jgi:hypothetical protein
MKRVTLLITALTVAGTLAPPAAATGKMVEIGTHAANNAIPWWGGSYNACRFQCMWLQSTINYAGYINAISWDRQSYTTSGTYNNVRAWLCHTDKTQLEATFNNNYTGNTPVQVMDKSTFTMPAGPGWVDFGIDPNKFNYNNTKNLLLEVRWRGDGGTTNYCSRTGDSTARVYNMTDDNATTGSVQITGQRIRLYIDTMTGVQPTSLGRVKSLFR